MKKINLVGRRRKPLGSARGRALGSARARTEGRRPARDRVGRRRRAFGWLAYAYLTLPTSGRSPTPIRRRPRSRVAGARGTRERQEDAAPRPALGPYSRISPNLKRAVLVAEDAAFWEHEGVDFDELQKSIELDWTRGLMRGASTITQQLAKNLYLAVAQPDSEVPRADHARRLEAELKRRASSRST